MYSPNVTYLDVLNFIDQHLDSVLDVRIPHVTGRLVDTVRRPVARKGGKRSIGLSLQDICGHCPAAIQVKLRGAYSPWLSLEEAREWIQSEVNDLGNTPAAQQQMDALCKDHDAQMDDGARWGRFFEAERDAA